MGEIKYHVYYKVKGSDERFQAGPYNREELDYHRDDIAGYNGVHSVSVEPVLAAGEEDGGEREGK